MKNGARCRVQGSGFKVQGSGCRVKKWNTVIYSKEDGNAQKNEE
jgi:hypothetical protein